MSRKNQVREVMSGLMDIAVQFEDLWGCELWIEYRNGSIYNKENMPDGGRFSLRIAKTNYLGGLFMGVGDLFMALYNTPIADCGLDIYSPTHKGFVLLERRLNQIMIDDAEARGERH